MSEPPRIAWLSRHALLPSQRAALLARFPGARIVERREWRAVRDDKMEAVAIAVLAGHFAEVAMVAPLSIYARMIALGVHPLYPEMEQLRARDPRAELTLDGRGLRFVRWRRVVRVALEFADV